MGFSNTNSMATGVQSVGGGLSVNLPSAPGGLSNYTGNLSDFQTLSLGMQGIGGVTSAAGAYDSTASRKNMLNLDAQIAGYQAGQAINTGQMQQESSDLQTGALFGRQRANLAANGVQLGSGSALDVLASTKYIGNLEANTIHNNALRAAWGYDTQAAIDKSAASSLSPGMSGLTTLLGSAGSVASSWYKFSSADTGM